MEKKSIITIMRSTTIMTTERAAVAGITMGMRSIMRADAVIITMKRGTSAIAGILMSMGKSRAAGADIVIARDISTNMGRVPGR